MDATLHALGGILLRAVPTFLLVLLLHLYLKNVFFKPLEKILRRRYEATEGARKLAQESMQRAEARAAEYEAQMRAVRGEVYQAQERFHKQLQDDHDARVAQARQRADAAIREAKAELAGEVESAKSGLRRESESLAGRITESILRRSAA